MVKYNKLKKWNWYKYDDVVFCYQGCVYYANEVYVSGIYFDTEYLHWDYGTCCVLKLTSELEEITAQEAVDFSIQLFKNYINTELKRKIPNYNEIL